MKFLSKEKNYKIVCLTKKKNEKLSSSQIKRLYIKEYNYLNLEKKLKKESFNFIINFAGNINHKKKIETYQAHFQLIKNIVKYINKTNSGLLIQAGSSLEYGKVKSPHKENQTCKPNSYYGKAKLLSTEYIKKNLKKYIILRLYQVYGPLQKKDRLIPIIIDSCLKDKNFPCTEGNQKRDFLFIDDFIKLVFLIIKSKKVYNGIYNVGYGKPIEVKKIIFMINKKINRGTPLYGKLRMRKDEVKILYPRLSKVRDTFNWSPSVNLNDGINKTINFYKRQI